MYAIFAVHYCNPYTLETVHIVDMMEVQLAV